MIAGLINAVIGIIEKFSFLPILLSRGVVGWVFFEAGLGKFKNLDRTIEFFATVGIPFAQYQAPMVAFIELVGGALLILGLASRVAALPLMIIMAVALKSAHMDEIKDLSSLFGMAPFLYIVLLSWIATQGPGKLSIDHLIGRQKA